LGADHWSEEGAEDEDFEEDVGEMEAVGLVVLEEGFVLMAEIEREMGVPFFQLG
jgi:hypothetical protein